MQTRKIYKKSRTLKKGGYVIGSGGYGCVFRPSLLCKGNKTRKKDMVSKLMTKKYARQEYKTIETIRNVLKRIPNYSRYFLLKDAHLCRPGKLSQKDLHDYETNCKPLEKKNFTEKNINKQLSKLLVLNLPEGGMMLSNYFCDICYKEILFRRNLFCTTSQLRRL